MKTEIKVIRALIENKPMTIREIAKKIKADYRITHTAVQRLIKKKIITTETIGKSSLCSLNQEHYGVETYQAEEERRNAIFKNKDIRQLCKEVLRKINTVFFILLLFGSYAKGKQAKQSDIDLMFISNEKDFEKNIHNVLSSLPLKTHVLVFAEEEFIRMKNSRKPNVVKEAMENNILLYNIENYYRLKNA